MALYGPLNDKLIEAYEDGHADAHQRMRGALDAMEGRHPASLSISDDVDDNIRLNLPRMVTDAAVEGMFGEEPEWESDNAAAQELLVAWRDAQRFQLTCQKLVETGSWAGQAFAKVDTTTTPGTVRIRVLDPLKVMPVVDPDDIEDCYAYVIKWQSLDAKGRRVWRRQIIERVSPDAWEIREEVSDNERRGWQGFGATPIIRWPYAWSPIHDCQNLPSPCDYLGRADLSPDVIDLCYSINAAASNGQKIIRLWAHPKPWGKGFDAKSIDWGPDEMPVLGPDGELNLLTVGGDANAILAFKGDLQDALHLISRTPSVRSGKLESAGAVSGVALQLLYGPQEGILGQKHLTYEPMLTSLQSHVAELARFGDPGEWVVTWPESTPRDMLVERQAAQIEVTTLGVSKMTWQEKLGYDPDQEAERAADEAAESMARAQTLIGGGADMQPPDSPMPAYNGGTPAQPAR